MRTPAIVSAPAAPDVNPAVVQPALQVCKRKKKGKKTRGVTNQAGAVVNVDVGAQPDDGRRADTHKDRIPDDVRARIRQGDNCYICLQPTEDGDGVCQLFASCGWLPFQLS